MGEMMIATRNGNTVVHSGDHLAGMRIIPLVIKKRKDGRSIKKITETPILEVKPFVFKKAAVITTGSEVYKGRIKRYIYSCYY